MSDPDWSRLVRQIADAGDRAAFQALFAHFAPRLKAYLMRRGLNVAAAEDLAQEALLALWRKAILFDPAKASVATWLFTIARNLCIDAARKDGRAPLDSEDPAFAPPEEESAEDGLMRAQGEAALRVALKSLPTDQAQIVQESFFAGKPHSQIADELGLPLGTVKSRLRLAMARLRAAIGEGK